MIRPFFSDQGKGLKLAVLGLVFLGLLAYYLQATPDKEMGWRPMYRYEASPAASRGGPVDLWGRPVLSLLPRGEGFVVPVGPEERRFKVWGRLRVEVGQRVDIVGDYLGPGAVHLLRAHVHQGSRLVKVSLSLAAALVALGLLASAFAWRRDQRGLLWPREDLRRRT